jgi:uncharacterized Zn finger protein (UPF0148 family)
MCPRSLAWRTSAPGLWKAAPDTPQPPRRQKGRAPRPAPGARPQAGGNQPLAGAPTTAVAAAGGVRGGKRPRLPSDDGSTKCPVHNSTRHTVVECQEIKKLMKQFREKMQQRQDDAPSRQREGKQKVDSQEQKDAEMEFQDAKRALKAVYGHSDSESDDNERCKMLHVMFEGSRAITYRRVINTLHREVAAAAPAPKVAPHHKWMETPIEFDSYDCPKSMAGASQLPLLVSPTISNVKLYHILIDGGAALNLISLTAFKELQIPMGKLQPSRPFFGVVPVLVTPHGCISLPVTFGTAESFCTESVLFDVAEVSLPFNAILGRSALYQFMVVAHYEYLVLKMPSPKGILNIRGDHDAGVSALEKLQALAAAHEATEEPGGQDLSPSSSHQRGSASSPHVQPEGVPVKTIQVGTEAEQTTHISGDLDSK